MKLAEDRQVVEALKQILEDYDYLEYDETWDDRNVLRVIVTNLEVEPKFRVEKEVRSRLEDATDRKFSSLNMMENIQNDDTNEVFTEFILYEVNSKEVKHP